VPFILGAPNLKDLVEQDGGAILSPPSDHVVFGSDPQKASLYFDFRSGALTTVTNKSGAVISKLVVQGTEVMLETTAFGAGPLPPGWPPQRYFHEDTTIVVMNEDATEAASDYDFLLHYLTAEHMPLSPPIPGAQDPGPIAVTEHLPPSLQAIGAGCSNSNYP
jgi:hypothetical protein